MTLRTLLQSLFFALLVLSIPLDAAQNCSSCANKRARRLVKYFPIADLQPAVHRHSGRQATEFMQNTKSIGLTLEHDSGRSLFNKDEHVQLIKSPFGFVVVEGHYLVAASLMRGAKTVPGRQILNLSWLPPEKFWSHLEGEGMAYLVDMQGQKRPPPASFKEVQADPLVDFATATLRRYPVDGDSEKSEGAEYPLWVTVGKHDAFSALRVADLLRKKGFVDSTLQSQPDADAIEVARKLLATEEIPGVRVVAKRVHFSEIDFTL